MNMHRLAIISCSLLAVALMGCQPTTLEFRNAKVMNGKIYAGSDNAPFSGEVNNAPSQLIFTTPEGFMKAANLFGKIVSNGTDPTMGLILSYGRLCDAKVSDGVLDGTVVCRRAQSQDIDIDARFSKGTLTGPLKIEMLPRGFTERVRTEVTIDRGQPSGSQRTVVIGTDTTLHTATWESGVLQGREEVFDKTTKKLIQEANLVDGRYDGLLTRLDPQGRLLRKINFDDGTILLDEQFDPNTGTMTLHAEYNQGKLNGTVKQWNADGSFLSTKAYSNGKEVHSGPPADGSATECLDKWIAAFRKEQGNEAVVTQDQIGEWETWCKAGKNP